MSEIKRRVFKKEEMGIDFGQISPKKEREEAGIKFTGFMGLNGKFFDKYIRFDTFVPYTNRFSRGLSIKTNIECPYCRNGVLVLTEKKKNIYETHVCHTGDSYTFRCSNIKECWSHFTYTNRWLYC